MGTTRQIRHAVTAALIVVGAFFLLYGKALASSDHSFTEVDCKVCHDGKAGGLAWQRTRPAGDVSPQCVKCHDSCDNWGEHREQLADRPAMTVALPLQGEGRIVCVTCHDPHARLVADAREQHPGQLRISNLKRELCLSCHASGGRGEGVVEVTIPPAGAITPDEYIPLLGRARGMGDTHLEVTINGATFPLPLQRGVFRTRLRLQDGLNRVDLRAAGKSLWSGEVFKSSPGSPAESYGRVYYGHQTSSLDECLECHEGRDGGFTAVTGTTPDLCYRCHEPLDNKRFLHGPLAVGECLSCHDPHGGIGPSHLRKNEVALCLTCHDADQVQEHGGWERAMADDSCSTCHDPHQSDTRFLVKEARL